MATDTSLTNLPVGFEYSVYVGCQSDENGVHTATADRIIGGWAATREAAVAKMNETLREVSADA